MARGRGHVEMRSKKAADGAMGLAAALRDRILIMQLSTVLGRDYGRRKPSWLTIVVNPW